MRSLLALFAPRSSHYRNPSHDALRTVAGLAALAASLPAQLQFDALPRKHLPPLLAPSAVATGDLDGDGDLDLVIGISNGQNLLYLNDGTGSFSDVTAARMPFDNDSTHALALGDVDGDGDLDVVFGNQGQNRLYLNNGSGVFTDVTTTQLPVQNERTRAVALGDVDGDGDLDLMIGNGDWYSSEQSRLYLNDGFGGFTDATAVRMPTHAGATSSLAVGDVDGDGDVDIVMGDDGPNFQSRQNRLYLNNGAGTFSDVTTTRMPMSIWRTGVMLLGDVDGDGDLDVVELNFDSDIFGPRRVPFRLFLNNGSGVFLDVTSFKMPGSLNNARCGVLADADGDGDLDIVFAGGGTGLWAHATSGLYANDGSGTFVDQSGGRIYTYYSAEAMASGDVDGDGDVDIVLGGTTCWFMNYTSNCETLFNLRRQLHAPVDLRIGQTYTLDAYLRYGPPSAGDVALPFLSLAPAALPLPPFGTIGIDPSQAVLLPLIAIPQPAGVGSLNLAIPNLPAYVGISLYSQALLVSSAQARLSNVVHDVLQ